MGWSSTTSVSSNRPPKSSSSLPNENFVKKRYVSIKLKIHRNIFITRSDSPLFIVEAERKSVRWIPGLMLLRGWKMQLQQTTSAIFSGWWFTTPTESRVAPCADSFAYIMHVYSYGSSYRRVQRASLEGVLRDHWLDEIRHARFLSFSPCYVCTIKERERNADWTKARENEGLDGWYRVRGQIIRRTKIPIVDDNNGKYEVSIIRCEYQLNLSLKIEILIIESLKWEGIE